MKVKALTPHMNCHGMAPEKAQGDVYEVPDHDGQILIDVGMCEKAPDDAEVTAATQPAPTAKTGKGKGADGAAG